MGEEGEEGGVTKRRAANKRRRVTSSTEMFIFYYFFVGNEQRAPLLLQFTRAFYFYLSLSLSRLQFFVTILLVVSSSKHCQRCYFSFQLIRFWRIERSLQIDFGGAFDSSIHRSCNTMCIITTKLGKERKYSDPSRLTSRLENISTRNPAIISFRL